MFKKLKAKMRVAKKKVIRKKSNENSSTEKCRSSRMDSH